MKNLSALFVACILYLFSPAQPGDSLFEHTDTMHTMNKEFTNVEEVKTAFNPPIPRRLSADSIRALKSMDEFGYMQTIDSFFRHRKIAKQPSADPAATKSKTIIINPRLRTLYWLVAFLLVIVVIFKMFIGKNSVFATNRKLVTDTHKKERTPARTDSNYENALKAMKEGDFRVAVRYLYLDALEIMGKKGMITISPQKTNYQYMKELDNEGLQKSFALLTMHYEYTWFGNFNLNSQQFNTILSAFRNFKTSLN